MLTRYQTIVLGMVVLFGASSVRGDEKAPTVSTAAVAAVMAGLDACFTEGWGEGPIYIEAGPLIPTGLNCVGRYKAEVITEDNLKTRFAGKRIAPSLGRARVVTKREKDQTIYTVEISYSAVPVKGANAFPIGGGGTNTKCLRAKSP